MTRSARPQIPSRHLDRLLGTETHLRVRMARTLMAAAVYALCVALQWISYGLGFSDLRGTWILSVLCLAGPLGFAVAVRSGLSSRCREPSLTMPQMIFAIATVASAYHVHAHFRGTMPMIVALILVYGAFILPPERCRQLGWFALAVFATTLFFGAWTQPATFPPDVELFTFAYMAMTVLPLSYLAGQLSRLRSKLQHQKQTLRAMMEELRLLATQDHLTGLPNRRHVQEWMPHEIERLHRSGEMLCLAIIDLDRFKRINDTFGHAAGDEVLRVFARETKAALRAGDVLARWGGEEFLLIMRNTPLQDAEATIERARARVALPASWAAFPHTRVTFSAGLTALKPGQTLEQAVQWADFALYEAKNQGRDRTIRAEVDEPPPSQDYWNVFTTI